MKAGVAIDESSAGVAIDAWKRLDPVACYSERATRPATRSLSTPEGQYGANCAPGGHRGSGVVAISSASPEDQGSEDI